MKAVVTGGAGFIGSHLVNHLVSQGIQVMILDNLASGKLRSIHPLAEFHQVDISSVEAKNLITSNKPDVVFHLAAQTDVQQSLMDPKYDAAVNICGTLNLLEACKEAKVHKFIFASTSAVYGNLQKEFISEKDLALPISFYGSSKRTAESYIRLYSQLYAIPYTILRFSNVYGPGQTAKGEGGVVAVFLERIHTQKQLSIHGDGEQTRDFIFVLDVVQAMMAAVEQGDQETVHVSSSKKTSVNHLVSMLSSIHGTALDIAHTPKRVGDIKHSCLDNRKAFQLLQWQPLVDLSSGLKETYTYEKHKQLHKKGEEDNETARTQRDV